jgi:hypothetical protein
MGKGFKNVPTPPYRVLLSGTAACELDVSCVFLARHRQRENLHPASRVRIFTQVFEDQTSLCDFELGLEAVDTEQGQGTRHERPYCDRLH